MSAAIPVHVALVDDSGVIGMTELQRVAGALSEQVAADFSPAWKTRATVGAYIVAPPHTWAIHLSEGIDEPDALGYHSDEHRQPFSRVDLSGGDWTVTASHELLEMLADPWGSRLHTAKAPQGWRGTTARVRYLLEVCDPCEAARYQVGGVPMSDFLLPAYYRSSHRRGVFYSHTGLLAAPLQVAPGGYVSWLDPVTGSWWQRMVNARGEAHDHELGPATGMSLREFADGAARELRGV